MQPVKSGFYYSALRAVLHAGRSTAGSIMLLCLEEKYTFGDFNT